MSRFGSRFALILLVTTTVPVTTGAAAEVFTQKPSVAAAIVNNAAVQETQASEADSNTSSQDALLQGPKASWIWGDKSPKPNQSFYFRKEFDGGAKSARLIAACDNTVDVFLNGQRVASSDDWNSPATANVQKYLKDSKNELLARATNDGSNQAALAVTLALTSADGKTRYVNTDESWQAATAADAKEWVKVHIQGKMGMEPWGNVFAGGGKESGGSSPKNVFNLLPGFQVELLYTVPKATQGSWVSLCLDGRGRLIASDQGGKGLYRITPGAPGSDEETRVEKLDAKITSAQGMLYAFDALYVSVNGGPGSGLYRCRDTNGDDQFDEVVKLKALQGGGEHGPHALRLSPDGKSIYLIAGNHTNPPQDFQDSRIPRNWSEDLLLPRQWDARGHARGKLAPGGWIAKTDPEGQSWEIFSIGYLNPYHFDFTADGELFAYDADMEWDMGMPWYRPTRTVHATSGSEFGWRSGTGKWPTYYPDTLPPLVEIGPGSPVGATFGYGAKFPARYQKALFILDWTFGTMYAIHIEPQGASYTAVKEEFLSRAPLPLTDAAVGQDGALYFTVGGRGTQSELYRVTYVGDQATGTAHAHDSEFAELRALRHKLESYHREGAGDVLAEVWPQLGHTDRHIRYAARIALEHRDVDQWQARAVAEKQPQAAITAMVALARQGDPEAQPEVLACLDRIDFGGLDESQQLELLRAYGLAFIRLGEPDQETAARLAERLDAYYPAKTNALNRELSQLLVYLKSPTVIDKTIKLIQGPSTQTMADLQELVARNPRYGGSIAGMLANQPDLQKLYYAFVLRNLRYGWTLEQRQAYHEFLNEAKKRSGGASYKGFLDNIRKDALANTSEAEQLALDADTIAPPPKPSELPQPQGPGKEWTVSEVVALANRGLSGRNFENGKKMFAAAKCGSCHRFGGEGGATGPDLTNVAGRFSNQDMSEAIIDPSKVISDQYKASLFATADGEVITGRVVGETDTTLSVLADAFDANKVVELKKEGLEIKPSPVSLMPTGLLNPLNADEVLDLFAYLMSRGNPNDLMFQ